MLFKDERFGMFIHWGLYSIHGWHEQEQWRKNIDKETYVQLAKQFNPEKFDAGQLVRFAKDCGAEYICFTTKHHDGFCMWDTAYTDFNIMNAPYGKDILKELSDACAAQNMPLALYYSNPDWHHKNAINAGGNHQMPTQNPGDEPDEELYKAYIKNQMRELLTGYGKICALFWDIPPESTDASINAYVRSLQPGILINDRGYDRGDYSTPERNIPEGEAFSRLTEACQSVGSQSWGFRENEDYYATSYLMKCIDKIRCRGGNYLLNVGPNAEGELCPEAKARFARIGDWYKRVCKSYGAYVGYEKGKYMLTADENCLYVHFNDAYLVSGLNFPTLSVLPKSARLLNRDTDLSCALELMPTSFKPGKPLKESLHVYGIPSEALLDEPIVLELQFEDMESVLRALRERFEMLVL